MTVDITFPEELLTDLSILPSVLKTLLKFSVIVTHGDGETTRMDIDQVTDPDTIEGVDAMLIGGGWDDDMEPTIAVSIPVDTITHIEVI